MSPSALTLARARSFVVNAGGRISPRRRRWHRFLRSLPLDPATLPRPLASPGDGDFIVCGCPRTGTTLLASVLWQPPTSLVVMEPWDGMRLPPAPLFASLRSEMATTGRLARGKLDVAALLAGGRVGWAPEGEAVAPISYDPNMKVGVKWPAWWQLLPLLPQTRFLVCLRDPFAVIASFKKQGGRLARGLEYDTTFNRALNDRLLASAAGDAERRVALYDQVHEGLFPHLDQPNVLAVRYERWFSDPQGLRNEIAGFLGVELGAGPAVINDERLPSELTPDETELIARTCRTGTRLGYNLSPDRPLGA